MSNDQTRRLMALKEKVEDSRSKCDRLQGQLDAEMGRLKKDYGIETIKQAKRRITELEKSIEDGNAKLSKELEKIETEIGEIEAKA